jgi:hypothetical protein
MKEELVAPCGMNCNVCAAYLAYTHDVKSIGIKMMCCKGCRPRDRPCAFVKKKCKKLLAKEIKYCHECGKFPCERLLALDKRYRTHFRMSEVENLEHIRDKGIKSFLKAEQKKWRCPDCGGVISCHNGICFDCSIEKLRKRKRIYRWDPD